MPKAQLHILNAKITTHTNYVVNLPLRDITGFETCLLDLTLQVNCNGVEDHRISA